MSAREQRRFLTPQHDGLVFGRDQRLSRADSCTNLVLVAPTGSGKTSRYVIPNILLAQGSVVVTDPAGEIFQKTSGHLRDRGFRIEVLQPAKLAESFRFNPLCFWRSHSQLRQLATLLANGVAGQHSDPFWTISATNVLFFSLAAVTALEDEQLVHLANLREVLNHLDNDHDRIQRFMARHLGAQSSRTLFSEYAAFRAMDARVRGSILATARAAVDLWSDAGVAAVTSGNTMEIGALRRELTALYLIVPEHQVGYYGVLANLFYATCFQLCLESGHAPEELPVYFFLDEFGNLGYVHEMATIMTTLRKRRCSVSLIVQELSQLRAVYGAEQARTIFSGGAANKLFFSGLDLETAQYVEQALGKNTEYDTTFGGIDEVSRTLSVPLMYADQVRRMGKNEAILISGRQHPLRFPLPPYFLSAHLRAMTEKPVFRVPGKGSGEVRKLRL